MTEPTMTIEVERRSKEDDFNILDLKLFHHECGGGHVNISRELNLYYLKCQRCDVNHAFYAHDENMISVINVAINGTEYEIDTHVGSIVHPVLHFVPKSSTPGL